MSRILDVLPGDFVRRMRNWAKSNAGMGSLGYGQQPMWRATPSGGRGELPINILSGEASDTDAAIAKLPARYGQAVKLFWQYEGQPLTALAKRCGVGVDYRTFEKRVMDGHDQLRGELARASDEARYKAERMREFAAAERILLTA